MEERGPRNHPSAMERAAFLEERAKELGVDVSKLIRRANVWQAPQRRLSIEERIPCQLPTQEGEKSWTSIVSDAMKERGEEFFPLEQNK